MSDAPSDTITPVKPGDAAEVSHRLASRVFRALVLLSREGCQSKADFLTALGTEPASSGLYLSQVIQSLKAIGCVIEKPTARNGQTVSLISNPMWTWSPLPETILTDLQHVAERWLPADQLIRWHNLMVRLRGMMTQVRTDSWLPSKLISMSMVQCLERAMNHKTLLEITYYRHDQAETPRQFHCLAVRWLYRRGRLYLIAARENQLTDAWLLIDRIVSFQT
jgi:hypothetical protein